MNEPQKLLERKAELHAIETAAAAVLTGAGQVVAVEGGAGSGKTSVLAEARRMADGMGFRVLHARGTELEQGFAFGVARQLFEPVLIGAGTDRAALLAGSAAPAAAVVGPADPGREPVGDFAGLHALFWLTANLSQRQPLAIVIDDLHWADEASLRFLAYLQPRVDGLRALVLLGHRDHDGAVHRSLLDRITVDESCTHLRLSPLSLSASSQLLRRFLGEKAEGRFVDECYTATRGNPLLLSELARTLLAGGMEPTADALRDASRTGLQTVTRRVQLWLDPLGTDARALASATAVLGGQAPIDQAAALAGLSAQSAWVAANALARAEILTPLGPTPTGDLAFVHPLVNTAVYEALPVIERLEGHRTAVGLLRDRHAEAERIAAHLLRIPADGDPGTVNVLRRAAADALGRGAPDSALTYLRRCLAEPMADADRLQVLVEAGDVARQVDMEAAPAYMLEAFELSGDVRQRAELAYQRGRVLYYLGRLEEARIVRVDALTWIPDEEVDLRRRIQAGMVCLGLIDPRLADLASLTARMRGAEPHLSLGGRMLDCAISLCDAMAADPTALPRAERGLDGLLQQMAGGDTAPDCAWWILVVTDQPEAMRSLDDAVKRAYDAASPHALAVTLTWRGLAWLRRGDLAEAEADLREAERAGDIAGADITRPLTGAFLATALIEQGRIDDAAKTLEWVATPHPLPLPYLLLDSRSAVLRAQGRHEEALQAALEAGHTYRTVGGHNPSFVSWRTEAALSLHALGRGGQALQHAQEELAIARRWGGPRALGRALRITGLTSPAGTGLDLLREAVATLHASPARLEHAKALADLGSALRRSGQRLESRGPLQQALEIAQSKGAVLLADHVRAELRSTGARPRRQAAIGPRSLTPSEHRVARLAADGKSNREIAQQLFVTPKTVEVHLTNSYRKLGITQRSALAHALGEG